MSSQEKFQKDEVGNIHAAAQSEAEFLGLTVKQPMPLPDNSLDGFRNGAVLDLRVRLAMSLLEHSPMFHGQALVSQQLTSEELGRIVPPRHSVTGSAILALDIADELFAEAEKRGYIHPLDSDAEALAGHAKRTVNFNHAGQKEQQRIQQQGVQVASAVAGAFNGPRQ